MFTKKLFSPKALITLSKPQFGKNGIRIASLFHTLQYNPQLITSLSVIRPNYPITIQRRLFSTESLSPNQIIQNIEECGINDAGKEKVLQTEIKKKNYDNLYNAGQQLIENEDTRELGVLANVLLAEAGYSKSVIELGNMYYLKWKTDKDDSKRKEFADHSLNQAITWLQKASNNKDAFAKTLLAKIYLESKGKDKIEESLQLLQEAGDQQNSDALYNLGLIYYDGLYTVPADEKKAIRYFEQAAKLNDSSSIYFMGQYYIINEVDVQKGVDYLNKAFSMKNAEAGLFLSDLYMEGEYVPKDVPKAWSYLLKAGDEYQDPEALNQIGIAYFTADYGQQVNYSKALNYFYQAANLGHSEAMKNMGIMYYNGYGVDKDYKKAFDYYTKASENGDLEALRNIGFMYMTGEGCEKDTKTAENILKFVELEEKKGAGNSMIENDEDIKENLLKQQ